MKERFLIRRLALLGAMQLYAFSSHPNDWGRSSWLAGDTRSARLGAHNGRFPWIQSTRSRRNQRGRLLPLSFKSSRRRLFFVPHLLLKPRWRHTLCLKLLGRTLACRLLGVQLGAQPRFIGNGVSGCLTRALQPTLSVGVLVT